MKELSLYAGAAPAILAFGMPAQAVASDPVKRINDYRDFVRESLAWLMVTFPGAAQMAGLSEA